MSEKNKRSKIIVILGPTASGKSDIAVALALRLGSTKFTTSRSGQAKKLGINGAEIVSADSRQVYKGLDIGTSKITKKEMKGVKHYLLDVASPRKQFTVSDFVKLTNKTIVQIVNRNKIPIVCGGTGFYIDALLGDKQIPEVPPNKKLRKQLEKKSAEKLFEILKKLDSERAKTIEKQNPRRLIRAIEICKALGKVPRLVDSSKQLVDRKYDVLKIGIKMDEQELKRRINKRIEKWFKRGLLKEVQNLHKKGLSWKKMSEIGLEYKIVAQYLQENQRSPSAKASRDKMMERMQIETWRYAKRQMTWFKKDPPERLGSFSRAGKNIIWLPPKIGLVEKEVKKFI